jgi:hypothetical protein
VTIPALILVLATAWCPTTTTTGPPETSTSQPALIIEPPHLEPPGTPTAPATTEAPATTTTRAAAIVDAATETRPLPRLPYTGPHNLVLPGGILTLLGGLFVAAGRRPPERR